MAFRFSEAGQLRGQSARLFDASATDVRALPSAYLVGERSASEPLRPQRASVFAARFPLALVAKAIPAD